MDSGKAWYEDDQFWKAIEATHFDTGRWASAPVQVEQLIALLDIPTGASVLDLCCGLGRHAFEFAQHGHKVTGVDRTQYYLEKARNQAEAEKLAIEFVLEDMREFCRPDMFDCAINLWSSFGYFEDPEDDRRVLLNVFQSLKKDGKIVMEMGGKEIFARDFREQNWHEADGNFLLEERTIHENWSRVENRWIVFRDNIRQEFTFSLRLYSGAELSELLKECGFRGVEIFGDLSGNPYDQDATRLVAVAKK